MSVNIEYLKHYFFYFDEPVPYALSDQYTLKIYPVSVRDSETFFACKNVIDQDKNSLPDVKIIQMSYLQYMIEYLCKEQENIGKLATILKTCLHLENVSVGYSSDKKPILIDTDKKIIIDSKQFDDIRRIILYQNIIDYDDEYINPELKKNLDEAAYLKNKNIELPSLERKIAIITSHTGILKSTQLEMTLRSHSLLFKEVYEETEYITMYPVIAMFGGKDKDKADRWIYKFKKDKFADQIISVSEFNKQAGGNGDIQQKIVDN